ncbi:DNA-binding response regulator (plasmid) [Fulvitalea axinellae]|uniref:DNA-binding response regulator n=1 Tax=Fulvitalea axinellae TaxID=1182444 RepID=A0AAU9CXA3_9BACT|nr:DNA-binding response regulator [Fulvitalea axinellae]
MTLKCLIIDDEKPARQLLRAYCSRVPDLEVVDDFKSAVAGLAALADNPVDLVFLDINMPEMTGLEFIKALSAPPAIIITTAFREYAVEGFELNVTDYLVKPIEFSRFMSAVNRVREQRGVDPATPHEAVTSHVVLKSDRKIYRVKLSDIEFVKADSEYVVYQTKSFGPLKVLDSMKRVEDQLRASGFRRIHRSYLVNLDEVRYIDTSRLFVGDHHLPISDGYRADLLDALG